MAEIKMSIGGINCQKEIPEKTQMTLKKLFKFSTKSMYGKHKKETKRSGGNNKV